MDILQVLCIKITPDNNLLVLSSFVARLNIIHVQISTSFIKAFSLYLCEAKYIVSLKTTIKNISKHAHKPEW